MSLSQLEGLILDNIKSGYNIVKHYIIEQMEDPDASSSDQNGEGQPARTSWYHVCLDETNKRERHLAWELGKHDIEFSKRYYGDFKRRRLREKGRKDLERNIKELHTKKILEKGSSKWCFATLI